jgi:hypothetical protein
MLPSIRHALGHSTNFISSELILHLYSLLKNEHFLLLFSLFCMVKHVHKKNCRSYIEYETNQQTCHQKMRTEKKFSSWNWILFKCRHTKNFLLIETRSLFFYSPKNSIYIILIFTRDDVFISIYSRTKNNIKILYEEKLEIYHPERLPFAFFFSSSSCSFFLYFCLLVVVCI